MNKPLILVVEDDIPVRPMDTGIGLPGPGMEQL